MAKKRKKTKKSKKSRKNQALKTLSARPAGSAVKKPVFETEPDGVKKTRIRVIGIGGGGGSIVSEISQRIKKASFVAANTDRQALKSISRKVIRFPFGQSLTQGLGTGMNSEIAALSAQNEKEKIKKLLQGQDLCVFVACLGGGAGSGAVPIFAKIAKNLGNIAYGIFTLPFKFEGEKKIQIAREAIEKLKPNLNAISIIPNDRIFQIIEKDTPLRTALSFINKHLAESLEALLETIYEPGLINIDFADLKTIFEGRGRLTYLNSVEVSKSEKNEDLVRKVLYSPLYPYSIRGAKGILFNIVGNRNLELSEVSQISKTISDSVNKEAKIIFGITQKQISDSKQKEGAIKITLLATGCSQRIFSEEAKEIKKVRRKRKQKIKPEKKKPEKAEETEEKTKKKRRKKRTKKIKPGNAESKVSIPTEEMNFSRPSVENKIEVKVRRNALEVKKDIEAVEKELIAEENKWELPAFLRRKNNKKIL